MSREHEIKNQILYYNNQIEMCNDNIFNMKKELEKLEQLSFSIDQMCSRFSECQINRVNAIKKISHLSVNTKMTDEYCNGMNNLLSGIDFCKVSNGLLYAKQNINNKICELQEEIEKKQIELYDLKNMIDRLYNELYSLSDV